MNDATTSPKMSEDAVARILYVTQKLAQPVDLMHMLAKVVEAGKSVLAADKSALWLYQADRDELVMRVPKLKLAPSVASGVGLGGECLSTRELFNVDDAYDEPRVMGVLD